MKAKLEIVDSIRQAVEVEASAQTVKKAQKTVLDKMRKEIKVPGFRKGKVPDNIIFQRYADEVKAETVRQVVQDTYPSVIVDSGANPISSPSVVPESDLKIGELFKYRATFEVYPQIELKEYEGLQLERNKVEISDEEVEAELKRLQQHMTQLEPAPDGKVGLDVVAMIDFKGTAGGEKFPGSEAENYVVDFGSGNLLKEFEVQIEGMKANEERKVEFHYPKDYFRKEIAGKKGEFLVKAKEVRRKIVPVLNDDFAKELGKYQSLKEVRADLEKRIREYKDQIEKNRLMEQSIRKIIEIHKDFEVPTTLIDSELGNMLEQLKRQHEAQGRNFDDLKLDPKEFVKANVEEATNRARGFMLISAIARKENVQITDGDVEARIARISEQSRQPVPKIKQQLEKNNQIAQLKSQLIFEKTLDLILDKAKIKEVKLKKAKK